MPFIPRVGNAIAKISVPQSVQKMFLVTSKDGPAAIAPLEGSVIVGRSIAETIRSGFLGLQERLTEESAAALIWLWGVKFMQRLFDRIKLLVFPKGKHLSGEIAWSRMGKRANNVDLTPQELFTLNAKEMKSLWQIKVLRLLASTGVALAGVAYVVPKLNQVKTNWILKNFYEGKQPNGASPSQPENQEGVSLQPTGGEIVPSGVGRTQPTIVPAGVSTSVVPQNASPTVIPASPLNLPKTFQAFGPSFNPSKFSSTSPWVSPSAQSTYEGKTLAEAGGVNVPSGVGTTQTTIVPAGVSPSAALPNTSPAAIPASPMNLPSTFQTFDSPVSSSSSWVSPSAQSTFENKMLAAAGGVTVPSGVGTTQPIMVPVNVPTSAISPSVSSTITPAFTGPISKTPHFAGSRSNSPLLNTPQPSTVPGSNPSAPVQFGLMGAGAFSNMVQNMGYAVEHTSYGNILVVDNGIVLGRAHVANKRSKYEAVEVIFRDVVSLYFYMLFAPHVMKAYAKMLDPVFQTHLQLQPKVAEELNNAISQRLAERVEHWIQNEPDASKRAAIQAAFKRGAVPKDFIKEILVGSQNPLLVEPATTFKKALRNTELQGPQGMLDLFRKELMAYGWRDEQMSRWNMQVQRFMRHTSSNHWNTADLDRLLTAIQQGQSNFSNMPESQRKEMIVALKNAFRHTAGIEVDLSDTLKLNGKPLAETHILGKIWSQLTPEEQTQVTQRIRRMAQIDGLNQVSTMWRRSLNLVRASVGEQTTLMNQGEMLAGWLDQAVSRHLTLSELLNDEVTSLEKSLRERGILDVQETLTPEKVRELSYSLRVQKGSGMRKLTARVANLNELLGSASGEYPLTAQITDRIESLLDEMLQAVEPSANHHLVLRQYQQLIQDRLRGTRGQLFSLAIQDKDLLLDAKLKDMLVGGLQNDTTFLKKAQDIVGDLIIDRRNFKNPMNLQKLRASMTTYGEKLLNYLDQDIVAGSEKLPQLIHWSGQGGPAEVFQKLNRNLNYMGRTISMVGAMLGLGILIPKMQYLITRKLTGKDENPGISSAERNLGIQHQKAATASSMA